MTVKSGFFSDGSSYNQADFNAFLLDSIGSGYVLGYENELEVTPNSPANMGVRVRTGRCYVQGYYGWVTGNEALTVPAAHNTFPRIDRVVARLSVSVNQSVTFVIKTGTPAANPSAPALTRTSETYEISLARIAVGAGATSIVAANITDERGDATVCGVAGVKHSWQYLTNVAIDVSGMSVDAGVSDRDPVYFNGTKWVVATKGAVGFYDYRHDAVITAGYLGGFTGLTPGEIVGNRGVALTATEIVVTPNPVNSPEPADMEGYILREPVFGGSTGTLIVPASSSSGNTPTTVTLNTYGTYAVVDHVIKCPLPSPYTIPVSLSYIDEFWYSSDNNSYARSYDADGVLIDSIGTYSGNLNIYGASYIILNGGTCSGGEYSGIAVTMSVGDIYVDSGDVPPST